MQRIKKTWRDFFSTSHNFVSKMTVPLSFKNWFDFFVSVFWYHFVNNLSYCSVILTKKVQNRLDAFRFN